MEAEREDKRVHVKSSSGRTTYPRDVRRVHGEDLGSIALTSSVAAHERAVMTVWLTLLLLIIGIALFFFTGSGDARPVLRKRSDLAELLR